MVASACGNGAGKFYANYDDTSCAEFYTLAGVEKSISSIRFFALPEESLFGFFPFRLSNRADSESIERSFHVSSVESAVGLNSTILEQVQTLSRKQNLWLRILMQVAFRQWKSFKGAGTTARI